MQDKERPKKQQLRAAVLGRVGARMNNADIAREIGVSEEDVAAALDEIEEEGRDAPPA